MIFKYQEAAIPFWAEGKDFSSGRDPLGIQNSSVTIYSTLLPGLTNVTNRLRYYGFYCWLLNSMSHRKLNFSIPRDQHNYIRKAEYTLAVYMQYYERAQQDVAGSDYASKHLGDIVDIAEGAEKHDTTKKGSVYWDYSSGVLGQYYLGSLQDKYNGMGLVHVEDDRLFSCTEKGKELGLAYGRGISAAAESRLFLLHT